MRRCEGRTWRARSIARERHRAKDLAVASPPRRIYRGEKRGWTIDRSQERRRKNKVASDSR